MQSYASKKSDDLKLIHRINDNIYNKCRCCLALGDHQRTLGDADLQILVENLNLFLINNSKLPTLICETCATALQDAVRFRLKVLASQTELLDAIKEEKDDEKLETENEIFPLGKVEESVDPLQMSNVKIEFDAEDADREDPVTSAIDTIEATKETLQKLTGKHRTRRTFRRKHSNTDITTKQTSFNETAGTTESEANAKETAIIEDSGILSPLSPGDEEICKELSGKWEEILDNEREDGDSPKSPQSVQDIYSNQITPLSFEAPTYFNRSSLIPIEGLIPVHNSTPPTELSILGKPISSPPNFPGSSMSPQSTGCNERSRTTKQRQRDQKEWADAKRKRLRNLGQKYVTRQGKVVEQKILGPACKCRNKCADKVSHQQRLDCFTKFWQLGDIAMQWNFIVKYSDKIKKKKRRRLNQDIPNNRTTYKYYLPLITDANESHCERVEVCQLMFTNTIAVTTKTLQTAWKKYDGSTVVEDKRGRHKNRNTVITDSMIQSVCDHVRTFAPVESHNIQNGQKKYLPRGFTISKMYRLYLEWFDAKIYTAKASTERQYRDIVKSNLRFHTSKQDQRTMIVT